jgi:hypothetical protein
MERFLLVPVDEELVIAEQDPNDEDNFEAQLKRARLAIPVITKSKYLNLSFIKPDTCVVERLFSLTNKVWVEGRKSMTPAHTELLLLLKCNRDLWDSQLVYKCRSNPRLRPNVEMQVDAVPLQLDDPDMEDHHFAFLQEGEDGDFWDDDNIAEMLGNIDI